MAAAIPRFYLKKSVNLEHTNYIESICSIENDQIILDGKAIFKTDADDFSEFSKKAYQQFEIAYPKFFKMDNLSKLAFLGAEVILKNETSNNDTALVFANRSSSLDTDSKYQKSISDAAQYFPSPAIFVYTLPNICLGEISIRHQLKSENSFFIFDAFNPEFMVNYANILLNTHRSEKVLCGWTEYYDEEYRLFLYLISRRGKIPHDIQTITKEYSK